MENIDILIVEDESIAANNIRKTVLELGYHVSQIVSNYDDCMKALQTHTPTLILLDITLHRSKSGIEIAQVINTHYQIPFIYITGDCDEATLSEAMHTNPCGYIVKPFKDEDIKSTIFKCLYQLSHPYTPPMPFLINMGKDYFYDTEARILYHHEYPIKLSPKEKLLIEIMITHKGNIVSNNILEEIIWEGNPVSENGLRMLVLRLRMKINPTIIENIPGIGYRLNDPERSF